MGCLGFIVAALIAYGIQATEPGYVPLIAAVLVAGLGFWLAVAREERRHHVFLFCGGSAIGYGCTWLDHHSWWLVGATAVLAGVAWVLHQPGDLNG